MSLLRTFTRLWIHITLLVICNNHFVSAQSGVLPEYQVKAAFIYNFTQFVDIPASTFSSSQAPYIIGIYGKDPFDNYLKEAISGEKVNGHPLVILRYQSMLEINSCQVLFISKDANDVDEVLASVKDRNILTVSDAPDFLQKGGMIRFLTKNNKIQLQINLRAAKAAKLEISSKLLRLAEVL